MTNERLIAYDATFMIVYIGLSAAMVSITVALAALLAAEIEFTSLHIAALAANLLGWSVLPFGPRLYRRLLGRSFSWRSNGVIGGETA
jgi:hypothetical protein